MIEDQLGYVFQNKDLLQKALSHSSLKDDGQEFERLEFLGDRVLGLVISNFLFAKFPEDKEGQMARKFASLVSAQSCFEIAMSIGLNDALKTANNKALKNNVNVLADATEALLGSVFLDGGFEIVTRVVLSLWNKMLKHVNIEDPKTQLQEITQEKYKITPEYTVISKKGSEHAPVFTTEVKVLDNIATGEGHSKKTSEIAAAKAMLSLLFGAK